MSPNGTRSQPFKIFQNNVPKYLKSLAFASQKEHPASLESPFWDSSHCLLISDESHLKNFDLTQLEWNSILIIIFQPGSYLFTFVFHPAAAETFQELAVLLYQVPPPIRTGAGAKNTNKEYKIEMFF